ncbi:MAG: aconitase X swivel domain-containing protein [Nitrososphaeria archaeon]
MIEKIRCKIVSERDAEGEIVFSEAPVNFYLADPKTSEIIEENHPLKGVRIKGKAVVMPSGKGSAVVQIDGLYQLYMNDNAPAIVVVKDPDPVIVSAVFISRVPFATSISNEQFEKLKKGGKLRLLYKEKELIYEGP